MNTKRTYWDLKITYWDLNEIQINRLAQQCSTNYTETPMVYCVQVNMLKLLYFVSVGRL